MCGSDLFLAILAIFFPPISGELSLKLVDSASSSTVTKKEVPTDHMRLQYGSKSVSARPTRSLTLPSAVSATSPVSYTHGISLLNTQNQMTVIQDMRQSQAMLRAAA